MPENVLFNGWDPIVRTVIIAVTAYPGMLLMVRISGHRTLAQLNAFDFIVNVALGSTLASVILTKNVSLIQGLLSFALLILMQYALARMAKASPGAERYVNGEPALLFHRGKFLDEAMHKARITNDEVNAAIRSEGHLSVDQIEAVVLETNGNLSVVQKSEGRESSAMKSVPAYSS